VNYLFLNFLDFFRNFEFGLFHISLVYEREGLAGLATASCAADAVNVVVIGGGNIVVDDMRDIADIEAARRDVCRNEDLRVMALEAVERALALTLRLVAMDRCALEAAGFEPL
jgi:hypothetical protein